MIFLIIRQKRWSKIIIEVKRLTAMIDETSTRMGKNMV